MSEATASKRPRREADAAAGNGCGPTTAPESNTEQVTSSSGGPESKPAVTTSATLLSEADRALQESNRRHVKPVVDESKLGIELFVGDRSKQYHGLIKARYADFVVHEIDPEGRLARLDCLEPPEEHDEHEDTRGNLRLEDLFDRKVLVCLSNVSLGALESYRIDVTGMDKDMRTSIHHAIKAEYAKLESSTVGDNNVPVFKKQQQQQQKVDTSRAGGESAKQPSEQAGEGEPDGLAQQVDGDKSDNDNGAQSKQVASTTDCPGSGAGEETSEQAGEQDEEKKFILVKRRNKNTRPKSVWPRGRPDYTHFILYKENKDTMDAIHNIAMATHSKPAHFNYAGTKDRRAVTSQWVSSWRLEPGRLLSAMRRYNKRPFLKVGNFCFKKEPIRLGQLRANKFDIVIRHLVHNSGGVSVIEEAMDIVKEKGFVNYFGLQRFGTRSISTHEVGLAILQGKWDKAVEMILSYRYDDNAQPPLTNPHSADAPASITANKNSDQESNGKLQPRDPEARLQSQNSTNNNNSNNNNNNKRWASGAEQHNACIDLWKSKRDADLVFKKYAHFRTTIEGLIIKSLSKPAQPAHESTLAGQEPYASAIGSLPRNTRSMYVHSYQSLIWNKLTTLRLKKFGSQVIPGDLILRPEANISDNSLDILLAVDEPDTPEAACAVVRPPEETSNKEELADRRMPVEEIDANIVVATEENKADYSIFDVVLPLVGTKTRVPPNEIGEELKRLLADDSITIENFRAREKAFISYGSYRKIMVRPEHLSWSIKQYSNPNENLVDTDLDLLNREASAAVGNAARAASDKRPASPIKSDSSDEALIVSFELPPSSYATMCLRELMKKPSTDFNNRF